MMVQLPSTDLVVSSICLGTGGFGSSVPADRVGDLLDAYLDLGGNFIDTAHNYGDWIPDLERSASEKAIGRYLKATGKRDQVVLATKGGHPFFDTPEQRRLSRAEIFSDLDSSLEALQVDHIDLYWLHFDDPARPEAEVIDTLNEAIDAGKVRYVGASNWATSRIRNANTYAAQAGKKGFVADQVLWSAAPLRVYPYGNKDVGFVNRERYDYHLESGMAMIPFQSQAFGLFQRMDHGTLDQMNPGFRGFYQAEESQARFERMKSISVETGLSISQLVLGYLTGQAIPTVPIVGCNSVAQVQDSMTALRVKLSPHQIDFIDGGAKGSELN